MAKPVFLLLKIFMVQLVNLSPKVSVKFIQAEILPFLKGMKKAFFQDADGGLNTAFVFMYIPELFEPLEEVIQKPMRSYLF